MKTFIIAACCITLGALPSVACNVLSPEDAEMLRGAIEDLPAQEKLDLAKQVSDQKALEYLRSKPKHKAVFRFYCEYWDPDDVTNGSPDYIPLSDVDSRTEYPTVKDLMDCIRLGIDVTSSLYSPGTGARYYSPEDLSYASCYNLVGGEYIKKEILRLRTLSKSDDPWDFVLPDGTNISGMEFRCRADASASDENDEFSEQSVEDFDPATAQADDWKKDLIPMPRPLGIEDVDPDDDDGSKLVKALIRLKAPPPLIKAAIENAAIAGAAVGVFGALVDAVCMGPLAEPWGCSAAPGLPGFDGTISESPSGGDK